MASSGVGAGIRAAALSCAAVVAMLLAASDAQGASVLAKTLDRDCRYGSDSTVLACDPTGRAKLITLSIGSAQPVHRSHGSASTGGREPLLPGEAINLSWRKASPRSQLMVTFASPVGVRTRVLTLTRRAAVVTVTNQDDGSLVVRSDDHIDVIAPPFTPAPTRWNPRNAADAARRILSATDRLRWSWKAWRTYCAALHPSVFAVFGSSLKYQNVTEVDGEAPPCIVTMALASDGGDNAPELVSSHRLSSSLRVSGNRAILRARYVKRFADSYGDTPVRRVVDAKALLLRDSTGVWRLAAFNSFLPLAGSDDERDYPLLTQLRAYRRAAAQIQREVDEREAEMAAATVTAAETAPCAAPQKADAAGDIVVGQGESAPRSRFGHPYTDVVSAGMAGNCVTVQTTGPMRGVTVINIVDTQIRVDASAGTVVVIENYDDGFEEVKPVQGIAASINGNQLVVLLPGPIDLHENPAEAELVSSVWQLDYSDRFTL